MSRRILVDCDGVLADFLSSALRVINRKTGRKGKNRFTEEQVTQWDICAALGVPELWPAVSEATGKKGFCAKIKPYEPARAGGFANIEKMGEVFIVTSPLAVPNWAYERGLWLQKHFGIRKTHIVQTEAKHLIAGDVLLDDKIENCVSWATEYPDKLALLWDAPYNRELPAHAVLPNIHRVVSWSHVAELIENLT